jgi:ribosome recycling factor
MPKEVVADLKRRMEGAVTALHSDLKGLRTGRANTSLLDRVVVEVYGSKMPLNQVATVNVPEARLITVQVWDKSNAAAVEKAIGNAGLGLNPMSDGALIRVPIPDLSEERRKELVKVAHQYAEKAKVAIRNVRRDGMDNLKKLEKAGSISEDDLRNYSDNIQKLTDEYVKNVDEAVSHKEKDILVG